MWCRGERVSRVREKHKTTTTTTLEIKYVFLHTKYTKVRYLHLHYMIRVRYIPTYIALHGHHIHTQVDEYVELGCPSGWTCDGSL